MSGGDEPIPLAVILTASAAGEGGGAESQDPAGLSQSQETLRPRFLPTCAHEETPPRMTHAIEEKA